MQQLYIKRDIADLCKQYKIEKAIHLKHEFVYKNPNKHCYLTSYLNSCVSSFGHIVLRLSEKQFP